MKQKALYDFAHNDYRLHGQLLVRLNFVRTWSACRTLSYYKVIREVTERLDEEIHEKGYFDAEGQRPNPFQPTPITVQYTYEKFVKPEYGAQVVSDFNEIERYKKALQWILSQMEEVSTKQRRKSHPQAYYTR